MGKFFISIKPWKNDSGSALADDFIDVTNDVIFGSFGTIKQNLGNNKYNVGIVQHSSFGLALNNSSGLYSDIGEPNTLFKFKRNNSLIKIEWDFYSEPKPLGLHKAGGFKCSKRQEIGTFLLNDDAMKSKSVSQTIGFKCLGKTTLFDQEDSNFSNLADGDLYSEIIFKMLNKTSITDFLTVTQANIVTGIDDTIDDKTAGDLENKTVTEVLKKILKYSNSILYIENDIVYVSNRDATTDLKHTFYGVGSLNGAENTFSIPQLRSGVHRVRNFVTYRGSSVFSQDASSIALHGTRKDEIEFKPITGTTKRQNAADAFRDEFKNAKVELIVEAPLNYDTLALRRKDKVKFDFPVRFLSNDGVLLPLYGAAVYDDIDLYPSEIADIEIDPAKDFKIMNIETDSKTETMRFECWEI